MKLKRKSYIESSTSEGIEVPSMISMFLVLVVVLFLLLTYSSLDRVHALINENEIKKANDTATNNLIKTTGELNNKKLELSKLQEDVEKLKNSVTGSIELINELDSIKTKNITVTQRLKSELERKKIISAQDANIYIAPDGNLVLANRYIFEADQSVLSENGKVAIKAVADELLNILNDQEIKKNIYCINIESHMANSQIDAKNKMLANQRAIEFLSYLYEANPGLEQNYSNYFVTINRFNSKLIDTTEGTEADIKNKRIQISVTLDEAAIKESIEKYIE